MIYFDAYLLLEKKGSKMKAQSTTTTIFFFVSCIVSTVFVGAEDNNYDDDANANAYRGFSVCSDTSIEVQDVQLYCDSPGTFYYGSGKYRNSQNCTAGDKGKFLIDFYIKDSDTIESAGEPVIDITAFGNVRMYERNQEVVANADLCSLSSLKSLSGSVCPAEGKYRIQSKFYWDQDNSNNGGYYSPVFYPTLSIGIKSSIYQNTYDYGGANTQYCSGTTFLTSWTNNVKAYYANSISNFFKSFGILLFTIIVMGAFIWIMVKRRPRTFEYAGTRSGYRKETELQTVVDEISYDEPSYSGSEKFDFEKMKSPRADQSFLDF